ncbi:unnamed protein product [Bursaphelenchus xylophilus]|uniref:RuvB-like helicase n=1 Tax=Bursaphelenchus xylophilus TaxID=6326 RepID=A0A1I7SDC8_BURXY|nr:unnamed protein product [Bursaphelenchus xylophilus]CAG9130603.1 unnamed protein product [Bursaphelenchus xylophilus]
MEVDESTVSISTKVKQEENAAIRSRVAAHSHVKGLGLDSSTGDAIDQAFGFIGQKQAREAAGIIVELVKQKKMAGRGVLFSGKPGTGKTAIALAIAQELGDKIPFIPMVASEVYSSEVKKTEVLMENFRRAINVRMMEKKEVYEGEVVQVTPFEQEGVNFGYGKTISHVELVLKTSKGSKKLKLDPSIYDDLLKQKVEVGDVIYIDVKAASVKRVGRSDVFATEFDVDADVYVPMPKGDVYKVKDVVQFCSLHDFDVANINPNGGQSDALSFFNQLMKPKKTEITEMLRDQVNKVVNNFIEEGTAELLPGVLFIDEVHMLDLECFTFLHRALESPISPIVVFATNRNLHSTDDNAPCIPLDLLDRLLIVHTKPYDRNEIASIVKVRADAEGVKLDQKSIEKLSNVGREASLRYVMQLLTPAKVLAQLNGRDTIEPQDVEDCEKLFLDGKRSARIA